MLGDALLMSVDAVWSKKKAFATFAIVAAFFQLRSPDFWADVLERMVSIPILGSLFIALKRKFERKS